MQAATSAARSEGNMSATAQNPTARPPIPVTVLTGYVDADEEIFEMNNGCICCTVRGDLIRIIGNLLKRKGRFDAILIETTGLADPAAVAPTFFVDGEVRSVAKLGLVGPVL